MKHFPAVALVVFVAACCWLLLLRIEEEQERIVSLRAVLDAQHVVYEENRRVMEIAQEELQQAKAQAEEQRRLLERCRRASP
jgi:HAMP domain-containing protein